MHAWPAFLPVSNVSESRFYAGSSWHALQHEHVVSDGSAAVDTSCRCRCSLLRNTSMRQRKRKQRSRPRPPHLLVVWMLHQGSANAAQAIELHGHGQRGASQARNVHIQLLDAVRRCHKATAVDGKATCGHRRSKVAPQQAVRWRGPSNDSDRRNGHPCLQRQRLHC